ncbi:MAG: Proline/betaine transporter [Syntrophorhabdus sp. PtaB.Bin184]|nr:MAG: Proline/betaine transporter [Syntrophorhabdus sp. PtaB.Bin184]
MDNKPAKIIVTVILAMIADGIDLQVLALALPTLMTQLGISPVLAGLLWTYTLIGMGIGGIGAGWASDRLGRVRVTWWCVLIFSLFTGMIGFCTEYWQIAVIRVVSGLGIGAVYSVGNLLVAECVPTGRRNTVLSVVMAGWSLGYVIAALISGIVISSWGWRPLFFLAAVPGLMCLVLMYGVSDPPVWLAAHQRFKRDGRNEFDAIWKDMRMRRTFLLWAATSIAMQFGFYGASTWFPAYLVRELHVSLKNMGWFLALSYTMGLFSKPIIGLLADRFGRRLMWMISGSCTSVAIPVILIFATPSNVAFLLLIFGALCGSLYAINATYLSESFPTAVRGTAMATSYNVGRVGSMVAPVFIGWVATGCSIGAGIASCAAAYLVTALLPGIFIREKMHDPMELGKDSGA